MKQHITPEQLNELSDKGKERLRKWCHKGYGKWVHVYKINTVNETVTRHEMILSSYEIPLLSIGQCLEFLEEKYGVRTIEWGKEEPIDMLWKKVKSFLEEKVEVVIQERRIDETRNNSKTVYGTK